MPTSSEPFISVIIPVHNAETTLLRALDSLAFPDCEIILVENSSTDHSYQLACDYAMENNRLKVFQSAPGVSNARNKGLEQASGEWIFFLDADDFFFKENLAKIADKLKSSQSDIITYNFHKGGHLVELFEVVEDFRRPEEREAFISRCLHQPTRYMTVWSKAFRARFIKGLRFDPSLRVSEDSHFFLQALLHAQAISTSPDLLYHYSIDSPSTMRTFDQSKLDGYLAALTRAQTIIKDQSTVLQEAFTAYTLAQFNLGMVREVFHQNNPQSYKAKLARLKEFSRSELFAAAFSGMSLKKVKGLGDIPLWLIKYHAYRLASLVYLVRVKQNARKER
ncbi:glycosyltransferase family 2 protein [Streptococcus tangpeifui]|uniref:glycosyltransferase family 2 protein n=1 Tax=Streptococcus tangpeifui TaxID=2709400 RepID=UPI0013EA698D|nr:glycosyltransferase family 2 protein [Streptococcus sp. ZJ1593]